MAINKDSLFQTILKWRAEHQAFNKCTIEQTDAALSKKFIELEEMSVRDFHADLLISINTEFGLKLPNSDDPLIDQLVRLTVQTPPTFTVNLEPSEPIRSIMEEIELHRNNIAHLKQHSGSFGQARIDFYIDQIKGSIAQCEKCLEPFEKLANPDFSSYYNYHKTRVSELKELVAEHTSL